MKDLINNWRCFPFRKKARTLWNATPLLLLWTIWKRGTWLYLKVSLFPLKELKFNSYALSLIRLVVLRRQTALLLLLCCIVTTATIKAFFFFFSRLGLLIRRLFLFQLFGSCVYSLYIHFLWMICFCPLPIKKAR